MERRLISIEYSRRTGYRWSWCSFPSQSSHWLLAEDWLLSQTLVTFISNSFLALACGFLEAILSYAGTDDITNAIDRWAAAKSQHLIPFHITQDQRNFWHPILQKFAITLSDQQFLTGLAILSAGLWEHCSISVYHFTLVLDMGWFSSTTHLVTISHLYPYLRRDKMRRNFRVFLMVIMIALLTTYTVMRSHKLWYLYWTTPAQCLFDDLAGNASRYSISLYIFAISLAYVSMIVMLYESAHEACRKWLLDKPTALLDKAIGIMRRRADIRHKSFSFLLKALLLVRWLFLGITALLSSWCFAYLVFWVWFAIGIYVIMVDRTLTASRIVGDENELTFGQFVPIFLLGSTAMVFRESYYGEILDQAGFGFNCW